MAGEERGGNSAFCVGAGLAAVNASSDTVSATCRCCAALTKAALLVTPRGATLSRFVVGWLVGGGVWGWLTGAVSVGVVVVVVVGSFKHCPPLHGAETRQRLPDPLRVKTSTTANAPLSKPCVNFTGMFLKELLESVPSRVSFCAHPPDYRVELKTWELL